MPTGTLLSTLPLITPDVDRLSPRGRLDPDARLQLYGPVPPTACITAEYGDDWVARGKVGKVSIASAVEAVVLAVRPTPLGLSTS